MAHSIIPHHHCDEVTGHGIPCTRLTDKPPHHSERLPWHCQAVSHLVLIERQLTIKFRTFHVFHFDMELHQDVIKTTHAEPVILPYLPSINLLLNKPFLTHQVLRGPPSIA